MVVNLSSISREVLVAFVQGLALDAMLSTSGVWLYCTHLISVFWLSIVLFCFHHMEGMCCSNVFCNLSKGRRWVPIWALHAPFVLQQTSIDDVLVLCMASSTLMWYLINTTDRVKMLWYVWNLFDQQQFAASQPPLQPIVSFSYWFTLFWNESTF